MKCQAILFVLILTIFKVNLVKLSLNLKSSDPLLSPISIANEVIVKNTINHVLEKGLNKSPIDLEPNRYHILNQIEHNDKYLETKTENIFYPGKEKESAITNKEPNVKTLRKNAFYYLKDKKPYYGHFSKGYRNLESLQSDGQMQVPILYMDLDDLKATEEQLNNLKERLNKAQFFVPKPNPDYDDNISKKLYKEDSKPYYNPMIKEVENGIKYLKETIKKVEMMLNQNDQINPKNPPIFVRVDSKTIEYQNANNAAKEDLSNNIIKNYYYPASKEDEDKVKDDQKKNNVKIPADSNSGNASKRENNIQQKNEK